MKLNPASPIFPSILWASAMLLTAYFFKGNPACYWIQSGLMAGAIATVLQKPRSGNCLR
jgi:hypothetical protein